ncbi:MAG: hypothetical protein IT340_09710 [Chloroflexi bacterium]|nr:hypothetical protein [Chloroflexota bacterium]
MPPDPADLVDHLAWPLGFTCAGTTDCPTTSLNRTLALLETARGRYHLLITADRFTRSRSLWVAWQPRETGLLTLIEELPEGMVEQAAVVIAAHLADDQPS